MDAAVDLWKRFPTQIEADLASRGHDIADWHQGKMLSRWLLAFLSGLGEEARWREARDRTYMVDGVKVVDWCKDRKILAFLAREVAMARWSARLTADTNPPNLLELMSPVEVATAVQQQRQRDDEREQTTAAMRSQLYANVKGGE